MVKMCKRANAQRKIRGRLRKSKYNSKRIKAELRKGRYNNKCAKTNAMVVRKTATGDLQRVICKRKSAKGNF